MQNEFEKQVQQKMEELKLVPSEPVWQKVEMQIRRKKERRRLFFWLPLALLLLGGAGYWMMADSGRQRTPGNPSPETVQPETLVVTQPPAAVSQKTATAGTAKRSRLQKQSSATSNTEPRNTPSLLATTTRTNKPGVEKAGPDERAVNERNAFPLTTTLAEGRQESTAERNPVKEATVGKGRPIETVAEKINRTDTSASDLDSSGKTVVGTPTERPASSQDSTVADTVFKAQPVPPGKHAAPGWKYAVVLHTGLSGLSRFDLFDGQKSLDLAAPSAGSPQPPPNAFYSSPKAPEKGLAFSLGFVTSTQLGKRSSFSVGLGYSYFSNSITVGNMVRRDTVFAQNYSVSKYYTPATASSQSYRNHYHFISLPLAVDWRLARRLPLELHTGVSILQLVQTNALYFDRSAQVYYSYPHAFNKTQLFSELALNYSFGLKRTNLKLGPQLQYGWSRMEKNGAGHHLFSYGLGVQLSFHKK